jgi:hypothetical protein
MSPAEFAKFSILIGQRAICGTPSGVLSHISNCGRYGAPGFSDSGRQEALLLRLSGRVRRGILLVSGNRKDCGQLFLGLIAVDLRFPFVQ